MVQVLRCWSSQRTEHQVLLQELSSVAVYTMIFHCLWPLVSAGPQQIQWIPPFYKFIHSVQFGPLMATNVSVNSIVVQRMMWLARQCQ